MPLAAAGAAVVVREDHLALAVLAANQEVRAPAGSPVIEQMCEAMPDAPKHPHDAAPHVTGRYASPPG